MSEKEKEVTNDDLKEIILEHFFGIKKKEDEEDETN